MYAALCSIFHSSDIFWPVWCLIHLGSFGIIWERSIEKCQWLEDGWSMLKQFIAALKQNHWGLHGLDYLQLGQNCLFGLVSYRVLSLIYAWYVLQYDSNFTWYVLHLCYNIACLFMSDLSFLKVSGMMFVQGCQGLEGVPKSKGHFEKVEAQLYSPTIVTVHIVCLQILGGPFKFGLSRGCDMLWHSAKFMTHGISWLKRKDAESDPGNALHKL